MCYVYMANSTKSPPLQIFLGRQLQLWEREVAILGTILLRNAMQVYTLCMYMFASLQLPILRQSRPTLRQSLKLVLWSMDLAKRLKTASALAVYTSPVVYACTRTILQHLAMGGSRVVLARGFLSDLKELSLSRIQLVCSLY